MNIDALSDTIFFSLGFAFFSALTHHAVEFYMLQLPRLPKIKCMIRICVNMLFDERKIAIRFQIVMMPLTHRIDDKLNQAL